jgi:hypothetical protein
MLKKSLSIFGALVLLSGCATTSTPTTPVPVGALTGYELIQFMSEARWSGDANEGGTFDQTYPAIKPRQTKGKVSGTWANNGQSGNYTSSWSVRGDWWCEKWSEGSDCWAVVVDGDSVTMHSQSGEVTEPNIVSPMTGPLRLTSEQLTVTEDTKTLGTWQYKSETGTYENHRCADGRYYLKSSNDEDWRPVMQWHVRDDMACRTENGQEKCGEVYLLSDGSRCGYRKTSEAAVTGQTEVAAEIWTVL